MVAPPTSYQEANWRLAAVALEALAPDEYQAVTVPAPREFEEHPGRVPFLAPVTDEGSLFWIIERSDLVHSVTYVARVSF